MSVNALQSLSTSFLPVEILLYRPGPFRCSLFVVVNVVRWLLWLKFASVDDCCLLVVG